MRKYLDEDNEKVPQATCSTEAAAARLQQLVVGERQPHRFTLAEIEEALSEKEKFVLCVSKQAVEIARLLDPLGRTTEQGKRILFQIAFSNGPFLFSIRRCPAGKLSRGPPIGASGGFAIESDTVWVQH